MRILILGRIVAIVLCSLTSFCAFSQIVINEAVSSNLEVTDQFGKTPDWFELYNAGTASVSLQNYSISDRSDFSERVSLPDISLQPDDYFLVFASGKNVAYSPDEVLHVPFKISASGETLYLFNGETVTDSLTVPERLFNYSVGKLLPQNLPIFFDTPTPGFQNTPYSFGGITENNLEFSHDGGVTTPFSLTISGAPSGAVIRYTLDATEPDTDSPQYTGSIEITRNTAVRASVFRAGAIPSFSESRTYITEGEHSLPIVTLVTAPDNFYDEEDGIFVFGADYEEEFPHFGANFWEEWERPMHFSLYDEEDNIAIAQNVGVKIFGGWSRAKDQRSLSIIARNSYGKDEIKFPVFEQRPYDEYRNLVLRNSGNDWLQINLKDALITSLCEGLDIEYLAYKPVVTYLNGAYFGMYNLREKINEYLVADKFGISPDSIDLLEANGIVIEGEAEDYLQMIDFVENNDLKTPANFEVVAEQIDLDNYALYLAMETYIGNSDWPQNNNKYWRHRNGGKWRWIFFDTDFSSLDYEFDINYFSRIFSPESPSWFTSLPSRLIENETFRNKFINQTADLMNSTLLPNKTDVHIANGIAVIEPEIQAHYDRWSGDTNLTLWYDRIQDLKNFFKERPAVAKQQIMEEFELATYHTLELENPQTQAGKIQVNTLTISDGLWQGDYFEGVPFMVTALPAPGYTFVEWRGDVSSQDASLSVNLTDQLHLIAIFTATGITSDDVVINEINYKSSEEVPTGDWIELHNTKATTVDLSSWTIKDDKDDNQYVFPAGTLLLGGEFLLIARDSVAFSTIYPDLKLTGEFDFGLSSNGDAVRLFDIFGDLVDEVTYLSEDPWPVAASGTGGTLELKLNQIDNHLPENWHALNPFGSPGRVNELIDSTEEQLLGGGKLTVFPNPTSDGEQLSFQYTGNEVTPIDLRVYDTRGRLLKSINYPQVMPGHYLIDLDYVNLSKGMYLLVFEQGDRQQAVKLVKI